MMNANISDEQKIYELSLIWREAEYNFAFWDRLEGKLDWDAAYRAALPAVLNTTNLLEYYMELKKFVALLRDGHSWVDFPNNFTDIPRLPFYLQYIDGQYVVADVRAAVADKIEQWSVIKAIDGIHIDDYLAQYVHPYIWHEKPESIGVSPTLAISLIGKPAEFVITHKGMTETICLHPCTSYADSPWLYNDTVLSCGEQFIDAYNSDSHSINMTNDDIAIITINGFINDDLPKDFEGNLPLLKKAKGYIVDIRKNGGGNELHAAAVASAFIDGDMFGERAFLPIHNGYYKAVGELRKRYESECKVHTAKEYGGYLMKPLAVLVSSHTASAAEDFLVMLDSAGKADFVGAHSYGSTGRPLMIPLESGGKARICTVQCAYADGRPFNNIGVKPHVPIEMTLDDYKNQFDAVMHKGLEHLRQGIRKAENQ